MLLCAGPAQFSDPEEAGAFLSSLEDDIEEPWFAETGLAGNNVPFKLDTGADVTVISHPLYQGLQTEPLQHAAKSMALAESNCLLWGSLQPT